MKVQITSIGLTILLSAGHLCAAGLGESAEDQQLLIQSVVDAAESAARRGDAKTAQSLVQQAYTDFAQYKKVSDEKKFEALGKIEEAARLASQAKPKQPEKKVSAADAEKERSILKTWLHNIKNIFDEKQALDLYERAKKDAAKFKHMSEEEIQNILQQIRNYIEFLRPAPKTVKQPTPQERKKEEGGKIIAPGGPSGPSNKTDVSIAAENRAKLSPEQQEKLDMHLWQGLNSNFGYGVSDVENDLKAGANPNAVIRKDGRVYAIANQVGKNILKVQNYKEYITLLVKYGFNINTKVIDTDFYQVPSGWWSTILITAMTNNFPFIPYEQGYNLISFLLNMGANPNITDSQGKAALHYLARSRHLRLNRKQLNSIIKLFIDNDANINLENNDHESLLTITVTHNLDFTRELMSFGANPFVGLDNHSDVLTVLNSEIKRLVDQNTERLKEGPSAIIKLAFPEKTIEYINELEEFKKELLQYIKTYKEKHRKEIREATAPALPVAQMPGVITEYLFGEDPSSPTAESQ